MKIGMKTICFHNKPNNNTQYTMIRNYSDAPNPEYNEKGKERNFGESEGWKLGVDFPVWANTEVYVKTVSKGYLLEGETPKDAYWRVATTIASRLRKPDL